MEFSFLENIGFDFQYTVGEVSRHNLVLIKCADNRLCDIIEKLKKSGINTVNIGLELAQKLKSKLNSKFLTIESQEYIEKLIESNSVEIVPGLPKVVSIYNLGMLIEPELSLNAARILKDLSKNIGILVLWEHTISNEGVLHWGSQDDNYNLDLSGIRIAWERDEHEIQGIDTF